MIPISRMRSFTTIKRSKKNKQKKQKILFENYEINKDIDLKIINVKVDKAKFDIHGNYIYKIENKVNGKLYIGQTINSIKKRFRKHLGQINSQNQCSALYSAIRKYGKENFIITEIVSGDFTKDELNNLEIFLFLRPLNLIVP